MDDDLDIPKIFIQKDELRQKVTRAITLSQDVDAQIRTRVQAGSLNFSNWVEETYRKEFGDLAVLKERRAALEAALTEVDAQLAREIRRAEHAATTLTREQRRYILNVPVKTQHGLTMNQICQFYNEEWGQNLSFEQFAKLTKAVLKEVHHA